MSPLPNMDQVYSLLLQDENHKEVYVNSNHTFDSVSFMATTLGKKYQKNGDQTFRGTDIN